MFMLRCIEDEFGLSFSGFIVSQGQENNGKVSNAFHHLSNTHVWGEREADIAARVIRWSLIIQALLHFYRLY